MSPGTIFRIGDILTKEEIRRASKIRRAAPPGDDARRICAELIEPQIARINAKLGHENVPMYLAYAVVYALSMADN